MNVPNLPALLMAAVCCAALLACNQANQSEESRRPDSRAPGAEAAAGGSIARDRGAASQTDSLHYQLAALEGRHVGRAMVTFRNQTADTAYFIHCNDATGVELQREVDGAWVRVWSPPQNGCHSPPIVVAPGNTLRRRVILFDGYQPEGADSVLPPPEKPATYRLVWTQLVHDYRRNASSERPLPLEQRVSNRFLMSRAPR